MTQQIDPTVYREVMGHYPTGVAVVTGFDTSAGTDEPIGMVVGTFSAVSMDPPLVSFMPQRSSGTYARLATSSAYCINVIAADQLDLCRTLAGRTPDKFDRVAWQHSAFGAPQLDDAVAHVHCRPAEVIEAGDHYIVLCTVDAMEVTRPASPLLFFQGGYGEFASTPPSARVTDGDLHDHGWFYFSEFPM
jgi:flavin reductase (DIM6/NTAB) family NADH-FMN oxidoreductase RutF